MKLKDDEYKFSAYYEFVGNLEDTAAFALALAVLSLTGVNT